MKKTSRYTVPVNEGYEPGSNGKVLKNYYGIISKEEIEAIEEQELDRVLADLEDLITDEYQFSSEDICAFHESWLGDIYPFAGKYRTVDMSKDGFPFAAASQIKRLMVEFESKYLQKYTPCRFKEIDKVAEALAIVHVEFILIHPFREGNGRLGRVLASLMANQAELPPLNFQPIDQISNPEGFVSYVNAIHRGVVCDYDGMENIFREVIMAS